MAQLIESALVPVIENALKGKTASREKEKALLALNVADIACGSGAFICAALEKLGEYLAIIRMGDEERPTEDQLREAKRDVLLNCIYGVDLNPMAIELAKFSLWITASLPDMPLTFLDHKLKCGNSLIGATPELVEKGIPQEAFNAVGNDNPAICSKLKAKVKKQLERLSEVKEPSPQYGLQFEKNSYDELLRLREALNHRKQSLPEEVAEAEEEYLQLEKKERKFKDWLMANAWTAAFFIDKTEHDLELYPTNITLELLRENQPVSPVLIEIILELAEQYKFFHFHLEFAEVFQNGGFDCILGNPPWEKLQAEENEFFQAYNQQIANEKDADTRKELIKNLEVDSKELYNRWLNFKFTIDKLSRFCIQSGIFKKSGVGNINLYKVFLDKSLQITTPKGRVGLIIQSGLFTDELSKSFFENLMSNNKLLTVYDFINLKNLFGIDKRMRFSLVTAGNLSNSLPLFKFYLVDPEQINNENLGVHLDLDTIKKINPNSLNCPMINETDTLNILKKVYSNSEIVKSDNSDALSYNCNFWGEMFNMTRGEKFFFDKVPELDFTALPLYESKYFHQFDHRFATFKGRSKEEKINGNARQMFDFEKISNEDIEFRYFVRKDTVLNKCERYNIDTNWLLCLRSITSSTNERTVISSILPKYGIANSINIVIPVNKIDAIILLGAFNSFVADFVAYTKVGNQNLNIYIIKQLPIPKKVFFEIKTIKDEIVERVFKLCYTSADLKPFATDFGFNGEPFIWNENERFHYRCELDAIYAHLYGLTKEEMEFIMGNFPIVKRKDIEKYGSYRTKDTILQLYDEFAWVREEMKQQQTIKPEQA